MFSCTKDSLKLTVMSYNIRYDNPSDSLNNWKYRKDVAIEMIKKINPDIVGTQEVLSNQLKDLKDNLPSYNAVGVGRVDGITEGEYSALFYKKDKFTELESGNFWLSETPEVPGSKGWDAACERIATWAFLEDNNTKHRFFAINTHLDHVGEVSRINAVQLIMDKAKAIAGEFPLILTGDFNAGPTSNVYKYVTDSRHPFYLLDVNAIAANGSNEQGTFHDFGRIPQAERERIDYIFVSQEVKADSYQVIEDKINDIYLSDHNPIVAKVILN